LRLEAVAAGATLSVGDAVLKPATPQWLRLPE